MNIIYIIYIYSVLELIESFNTFSNKFKPNKLNLGSMIIQVFFIVQKVEGL